MKNSSRSVVIVILSFLTVCVIAYAAFVYLAPVQTEATPSVESSHSDAEATDYEVARQSAANPEARPVSISTPNLKSIEQGHSFVWPHDIKTDTWSGEGYELLNDSRTAVAQVHCGGLGFYEGPYESKELKRMQRTFVRDGKTYTIQYREHEYILYNNDVPEDSKGMAQRVSIEVSTDAAMAARRSSMEVADGGFCTVLAEVDDYKNSFLTEELVADMRAVYETWR